MDIKAPELAVWSCAPGNHKAAVSKRRNVVMRLNASRIGVYNEISPQNATVRFENTRMNVGAKFPRDDETTIAQDFKFMRSIATNPDVGIPSSINPEKPVHAVNNGNLTIRKWGGFF
ncbi:hypothetical protein AB4072_09495 [Microvirga sp. 2MCAF38]|uniref:hypothetical protein n=1 Tax=Microvirga sp. 2MCAF38 TaxID=3232989 RepID=UPI003F968A50